MFREVFLLLAASGLLAACNAAPDLQRRDFIGMTQAQLRAELGEPHQVEELTKNMEHIWGPVEDLWYRMDPGDALTTWTYEAADGRMELYFVPGSDAVAEQFFWYKDTSKNPVF